MTKVAIASLFIITGLVIYVILGRQDIDQDSGTTKTAELQTTINDRLADHEIVDDTEVETNAGAVPSTGFIQSVPPELVSRYEDVVQDRYFKDGPPRNYRRHRIVEIDTEQFEIRLKNMITTMSMGDEVAPIPLQLFDDREIQVLVRQIIDSEPGMTGAFGYEYDAGPAASNVEFYIASGGRLEGTIANESAAYLLAAVGDTRYYVIMELDRDLVID